MKNLFTILCLFIACTSYAQLKTFSKGNYTIQYPATWEVAKGADANNLSITAPADSGVVNDFVENINLVVNNISGQTLKSYAEYSKGYLPSKIKKFKVSKEAAIKQNGKDAYYMIFSGEQEGHRLQWKQYYLINDGKMYILTFTAEQKRFADYLKKIESSLKSFKVK